MSCINNTKVLIRQLHVKGTKKVALLMAIEKFNSNLDSFIPYFYAPDGIQCTNSSTQSTNEAI